jgi:zinc transport system substrate-binding protein
MRRPLLLALPALASLLLLLSATARAEPRPVVVATVAPLGHLVERLAGDRVELRVALPPGVEIETFAPSPQQIRSLAGARLVVGVGHPAFALESSYLRPFVDRQAGVAWLDLAATVSGEGSEHDPHLWVSPRVMARLVTPLADALAALLPAAAGEVRARAEVLAAEIAALDAELAARFEVRRGQRFLIQHPALGHFARDYGLVQEALEQDGKEASAGRLAALAARAGRAEVRAVLVQPGGHRRAAEALARQIGAEVVEIDPLAADWPAALRRIADVLSEALYVE